MGLLAGAVGVLLPIIGEATQQVLVGTDSSITMAAIVIATLIAAVRFADYLGYRFRSWTDVTHGAGLRDAGHSPGQVRPVRCGRFA